MNDAIEDRLPVRVQPDVQETYRLLFAFVQIRDRAARDRLIEAAEALMGEQKPSASVTIDDDLKTGNGG